MRRLPLVMMVLSLPLATACSFLFDLDGYAGDASSDAPSDTEVLAEVIVDAGADAPHFCDTQTQPANVVWYLCADFDEQDSGPFGDPNGQCSGCAANIVADDDSPPDAWVFSIPIQASTGGQLFYQSDTTGYPNFANIAFDVKGDTTDPLFLALFGAGNVIFELALSTKTPWTLREQSYDDAGGEQDYPLTTVVDTQWHRFSMSLDLQTSKAIVLIDGSSVLTQVLQYSVGNAVAYQIGIDYIGPTLTPTRYHFDNIVLSTAL